MKHEPIELADIPTEGSVIVPFFGRDLHVFLAEGRPRAVANVCLHFGGPLECKDGAFVRPWHQARFDRTSGRRIDGPAPKDARLMTLSTRVEGDSVFHVWGEAR